MFIPKQSLFITAVENITALMFMFIRQLLSSTFNLINGLTGEWMEGVGGAAWLLIPYINYDQEQMRKKIPLFAPECMYNYD